VDCDLGRPVNQNLKISQAILNDRIARNSHIEVGHEWRELARLFFPRTELVAAIGAQWL